MREIEKDRKRMKKEAREEEAGKIRDFDFFFLFTYYY